MTREATKLRKIQESNARSEQVAQLDDELETLKRQAKEIAERTKALRAQKKGVVGERGRGSGPKAADSSCGRVPSACPAGE
jgi:hypothetical protein